MTATTLLLLAFVTFVTIATPGPSVLLALTGSLAFYRRAAS